MMKMRSSGRVLRLTAATLAAVGFAAGCNARPPAAVSAMERTAAPAAGQVPQLPDITGQEKIGWEHELVPTTKLGDYTYSVYIDYTLTPLSGSVCLLRGIIAECYAKLPPMSPGPHSLSVVAIRANGPTPSPSHPSRAIGVNMTLPTSGVRLSNRE